MISRISRYLWKLFFHAGRVSYSQNGEDIILDQIFCKLKNGFYVDIGANNPFVQSNTYFFYRKGWRGINVDALPGSMEVFRKFRSRDINLEVAVSNEESVLDFYMFKSSFFNTFSAREAQENKQYSELIRQQKIKTRTLQAILEEQGVTSFDFLSVDVEGFDLNVLRSVNLEIIRPKVILFEFFCSEISKISESEIGAYLKSSGYRYLCNTTSNVFFIEKQYFAERFLSESFQLGAQDK